MTIHPQIRQTGALLAVAAGIAVLHLLGGGALALPRSPSATAIVTWATDREPVTVGFAVIRLIALAAAYHLAATTAIGLAGRIMSLPGWVEAADAWTLPPLRTTWGRLAGLGLSATAALTAPVPTSTAASMPDASMRVVEVTPPPPSGRATMTVVEGRPTEPEPEAGPVRPEPDRHEVGAGDHLWSIAEARLTEELGRPVDDREIDSYWRRLIAANPQLTDPDLIFPGQMITVPPSSTP